MDDQIFVKIEDYNEILKIVDAVKEKIAKAHETIGHVSELRSKEVKELEVWSDNLEKITNKVADIEESLSQTHD